MMRSCGPISSLGFALCVAVLLTLAAPTTRAEEWRVEDAPIRFKLALAGPPTHSSAGYFVQLPDGGILPRPFPRTRVFNEKGTEFKSFVLWQNELSGVGIVFEAPAPKGSVYVYVSPAQALETWSPATGLTPSALLCADPDRGTMDVANRLGKMGAVGPRVHYVNKPGVSQSPVCIQGDLTGRLQPCSFYMLVYLVVSDPGKTWFAPFANVGTVDLRVDGKRISAQNTIAKWGGSGNSVHLEKGLCKVEILSACDEPGESFGNRGVMWLTWRPPHATVEELGGSRPEGVPFAGSAKWASRVLRNEEIVRSGRCVLQEITARDGGPVAHLEAHTTECFWYGDDKPMFIYSLTASTFGNPKDTEYTWDVSGAKLTGNRVSALLRGLTEQRITLTALAGGKQSRSTLPFHAYSGVKSDLNSRSTRSRFRTVCLEMLQGQPPGTDPIAAWDTTVWRTFFESMELGKGAALLAEVLLKHWDSAAKHISVEQQILLEDIFYYWLAYYDSDKALEWLERQAHKPRDGEHLKQIRTRMAEVYMYHKGDFDSADRLLRPLVRGSSAEARRATVRLGDLAFLQGDLNAANQHWGRIQDGGARSSRAAGSIREWKKGAVIDSSMSSAVRGMIAQEYFAEAMVAMRAWELQYPQSKLTSDYMVQEAKLFTEIGDHKRARVLLESYLANVDASSYLPKAVSMLLSLMMDDDESDEVLREFCRDMKERFAFHAVAKQLDATLRVIETGTVDRDSTIDYRPRPAQK